MAALAALAALGMTGCGSGRDSEATAEFGVSTDVPSADLAIGGGAPEEVPAVEAGDTVTEPAATAPATGGSSSVVLPEGRDLIIEMGMTLATTNVDRTDRDVRRLAEANGGWIAGSDVTIGDRLEDGAVTGGGTIDIRILPSQLNALIDDLRGVARVTRQEQATQDATAQLVDLGIRIRQARTGIAQIEVLYAQATEFADLVEIEQELSKRQIALEQLLAAQAGVEGRVAESRLTITITYEPIVADPVVSEEQGPADDGIADAFHRGWDAFAGALFAVGFVLAVMAPFLVLGLSVLLVAWLVTRRRGRRDPLPAPASNPASATPVGPTTDEELVGASHAD